MNENTLIFSIPFLTTLIAFIKVYSMIKKFDVSEKVETNSKDIISCKSEITAVKERVVKVETILNNDKTEHTEIKEIINRLDTKIDNKMDSLRDLLIEGLKK